MYIPPRYGNKRPIVKKGIVGLGNPLRDSLIQAANILEGSEKNVIEAEKTQKHYQELAIMGKIVLGLIGVTAAYLLVVNVTKEQSRQSR
jgi:hypothetical protein